MKRELLLLRHGKSDWNTDADDFHRPLKDRGKRDAQRMGVWLQQQGLVPDYVVSSPAERAMVTAEKTCKVMGCPVSRIHPEHRIYAADPGSLLAVIRACPDAARRVLLIGHNPGLEEVLELLSAEALETPPDGKLLPTATLAHLELEVDHWEQVRWGIARVRAITRPSALAEGFPYPDHQGKERRDRPAYYYTQSSVIPYRIHDGGLEILLISSSKKKHWVVPKGIHEPGLTAQASAAKEAFEEAGIEGAIGDEPLGVYRYPKWGGTCTVTVYPMAVTREVPEREWEESHRGRRWVTPSKARKLLKQKQLIPMLDALETRVLTG